MNKTEAEKVLEHYGIKGMRWGVRRKRKPSSSDAKTVAALRKKKASELSNEELRKVNERLALEKTYRTVNSSASSRGKKAVLGILGSAGKQVLSNLIAQELSGYAKTVMTEALKRK
jgi:hypothetical protein